MFVALAIVLHCKPEALTSVLPTLREDPKYQGHNKLPICKPYKLFYKPYKLSYNLYAFLNGYRLLQMI